MISLYENSGSEKSIVEELIPKKVRFIDKEEERSNGMMIDLSLDQLTSWRDKLVGHSSKDVFNDSEEKKVIDILEWDIQKTIRNSNKFYNMWRPSAPLNMMDIENGYFLVKFQNKLDCEKALSEGLWTIFGQYLTVQPWTLAFDPTQAYPSVVIAWIRFPALPNYLYNRKIITEIGELVGKVVNLDMNTNSRARGRFARMAVYVNLEKPLVSQILINGRSQKAEYEYLSTICFHCRRYDHVENLCTFRNPDLTIEKNIDSPEMIPKNQNFRGGLVKKDENYGPGHQRNAGPKVGSSLVPNGANENLQNSEELTTGLDLGDISANQARDLMDQDGQEEVAHCSRTLVAVRVPSGSNDGVVLHVEGESSAYPLALTLNGCDRKEVVEVGSLDSGKHLEYLGVNYLCIHWYFRVFNGQLDEWIGDTSNECRQSNSRIIVYIGEPVEGTASGHGRVPWLCAPN
ncbi:hypothetical protein CXB51_002741 [Gossypium anomalum]|uniref:DUF4283 domain-containing protein n=1 Tax=Gossypium anomalum TaxID=47600 RepID=A0A8J5ZHM5_9ROSI|nr:hypothetical protein CXB51_002741 [Gossypium anomalum]